jgi:hypothetical protein
MTNSVELKGLTEVSALLKGLPSQVKRAQRNATNVTLTHVNRNIIATVNTGTGLVKKQARNNLIVTRPRQGEVFGSIRASDTRIRLRHYKPTINRLTPTQAAITVKTEINKQAAQSGSAFVNPKFNKKVIMRRTGRHHIAKRGRYAGKRREKTATAFGPAMSVHLNHMFENGLMADVADFYQQTFLSKLDDQLARTGGKRR